MSIITLVTGANRGLGLGFVKHLLQQSSSNIVVATARDVTAATDLQELKKKEPQRLHVVSLDISVDSSVE
ncbi:hypothetical protein BDK51DRAFT_47129, partial [Blyttiomyces helicus]